MVHRVVIGVGLALLGFYLGREVVRTRPVHQALAQARIKRQIQKAVIRPSLH